MAAIDYRHWMGITFCSMGDFLAISGMKGAGRFDQMGVPAGSNFSNTWRTSSPFLSFTTFFK